MLLKRIENFWSFIFTELSVRKKLSHLFRKEFLKHELKFLIYEKDIINISVFLFVSSAFFYRKENERYFEFNWKSYLKIFSNVNMREFLICSIKFLLDNKFITRNVKEIKDFLPIKNINLEKQYMLSLIKKNSKEYSINNDINFVKYLNLVNKAMIIHNFYKYGIPNDHSKVCELVKFTFDWKKEVFEVFGNRSEYIVFVFFTNLDR